MDFLLDLPLAFWHLFSSLILVEIVKLDYCACFPIVYVEWPPWTPLSTNFLTSAVITFQAAMNTPQPLSFQDATDELLRRDIAALKVLRPPHGLSNIPCALNIYKEVDAVVSRVLANLNERAGAAASRLPANKIFGPWEGGLLASGDEPTTEQPLPFDLKVLCWNIRGAH